MMVTLGFFYILIYLLSMLIFFTLSFAFFPIQLLTTYSITTFFIFLQKYTRFRIIFLLLIFSLTGLPPVGLFLVKVNILISLLYSSHVFVILLLTLFFFLNMLYYIQLFSAKNYKKDIYPLVNNNLYNLWFKEYFFLSHRTTYTVYRLVFFCILGLGLIYFNIFVFTDFFLFFYNL